MLDSLIADQNQWVGRLFKAILEVLKSLDWQQDAPDVFLVYAHDNNRINKPADAEIARRLIDWLIELGANIYSDRSMGREQLYKVTPSDTAKVHDILANQLGLLPHNKLTSLTGRREHVILCGSALLKHYESSEPYYKDRYYPGLHQAYQSTQKQSSLANAQSKLAEYINAEANKNKKGFHHILTELAFLQIRAENEDSHRILPLLLNGSPETSFPQFIIHPTNIRIEDAAWQEQPVGLHMAFFKLLKRLWVGKEREIKIMEEEVYQYCLQALRSEEAPQSANEFASLIQGVIWNAKQTLINSQSHTLRILSHQEQFNKIEAIILKGKEKEHEFDAGRHLKEWYPTLTHRLAIQRVAGDTLPMESCYINLAVVEYRPKEANKEEEQLKQLFYRLPSVESVENTNLKEPIALEDLFKSRRLKSGDEGMPRRILIRGRAGIGKTTLAKKSLHDYLHQGLWRDHFEWLLWIPLRHLKGKKEHYSLKTFLYEEYFEQYREGWELAQALYHRIQAAPPKTLLICDGWDEVLQEKRVACLSELLNHPSVIITSRSYGINVSEIKALDLELETVGFSEANVIAYLDHPTIILPEVAEEIKAFMKQHPFVRELVNIPIQLDALCYSWDEISFEGQQTSTMTALYERMVHKLLRKDIVRLDKTIDDEALTAERVQRIRPFRHLEPLIKAESTCLGALALNGLHRNQLEFKPKDLEEVVKHLEKNHRKLPLEVETNVMQLSCLQVEKNMRSSQRLNYQFLHLTFQEFFAAQWLVECLREEKTLSLIGSPEIRAEGFIRAHQYNPRYEIVWWFVAGLLSGEALKIFFDRLSQGPQDLIGIQHQHLMMHCLKESNGKLPKEEQERLESDLYTWLAFEVEQVTYFCSRISTLGCQAAFPERLLHKWLEEKSQSSPARSVIIRTLGYRSTLSDSAITSLIKFLKYRRGEMRKAAADALSQQSSLAPETLVKLNELLKEENEEVRDLAADALGRQSILSPETAASLIRLLQNKSSIWKAAFALRRQPSLSPETVASLIGLLQDEDLHDEPWCLGNAITGVLEKQLKLPRMVVKPLTQLLDYRDSYQCYQTLCAKRRAAKILSQQSNLPSETIASLLRHVQAVYTDEDVREAAAEALSRRSILNHPKVMSTLIRLSQHKNRDVRASVARALVGKSNLLYPEAEISSIRLLQDTDWLVRSSAARALGQQARLSQVMITSLITLCKDEDAFVRGWASKVLLEKSIPSSEAVASLIDLLKTNYRTYKPPHASLPALAAQVLGQQSSLSPEAVASLIELLEKENGSGQGEAAQVLGQQSRLPSGAVHSLIGLLNNKDEKVRYWTGEALKKQPPWHGYQALLTENPSFIKELYRGYLIPSNFKQISPLYIENNQLCFYSSTQFESVSLDKAAEFKEAILKAQTELGIPIASRIKLNTQNTDLGEDQPSSSSSLKHEEAILKAQTEVDLPLASQIKLDIQNTDLGEDQPSSRSRLRHKVSGFFQGTDLGKDQASSSSRLKHKVSKVFRRLHDDTNRSRESESPENTRLRRAM